jgi:hypothetical protein
MKFFPIFAHGGAIVPLLALGSCAIVCIILGLTLAINAKKTTHWLIGAGLGLCGLLIIIITALSFDKLVKAFS